MRFSRRRNQSLLVLPLLVVSALAGGVWLAAQQVPPAPPPTPAAVLRVTTRLVLVDVVVTDRDGRPVTDLKPEDFTLLEDGHPQPISTFSLEQPGRPAEERSAPPPKLPPDVYTNRPEYRLAPGPLTILLLDVLNTPARDQAYAREQMLRYLATQLKPGQRTAILVLGNSLLLLQDFTTDPRLLQAALQKLRPQTSAALGREEATTEIPVQVADMVPQAVVQNLQRMEAEYVAVATDSRVAMTLAALRAIARATAGYPGRKNLIWVSASFPFVLIPEQAENFDLFRSYADEMRRTANQLTDAQVAVYPVDARGLVGYTIADASDSGRQRFGGRVRSGGGFGDQVARNNQMLVDTQHTMRQIAADTGGRAFTNRNDIDQAVALGTTDGSTYYTLGYYPQDKAWDGKFRRIQVKVARKRLEVRHRRGYYAVDPIARPEETPAKEKEAELLAALSDPLPPNLVTFLAHVPPPTGSAVTIEFSVDAHTLAFEEVEEGRQHCNVDFLAAAFSPEGKVVKSASQTVDARLRPETFTRARQEGLPFRLQLELDPGRYQMRLIVRDNRTGMLGTVDVPLLVGQP